MPGAGAQGHRHGAERLGGHDAGEPGDLAQCALRPRLDQRDAHVVALGLEELHLDDVLDGADGKHRPDHDGHADAIPSVVSPARTGQREMWRRMMRVNWLIQAVAPERSSQPRR
jgi:hypothetical protein